MSTNQELPPFDLSHVLQQEENSLLKLDSTAFIKQIQRQADTIKMMTPEEQMRAIVGEDWLYNDEGFHKITGRTRMETYLHLVSHFQTPDLNEEMSCHK